MSQASQSTMSQPEDSSTKHYGSSESESRGPSSSSGPKKRASRAGTRSVNNLSAAQLERKRANDRDAQRAIRKRTKDHIETLEQKVNELSLNADSLERVNASLAARNRELEQENGYLRSRMGSDAFLLSLPNAEAKPADSSMGLPPTQTSPQLRFSPHDVPRQDSLTGRHSISAASAAAAKRSESWRQQSQPPLFAASEASVPSSSSRTEPSRTTGWRNPTDTTGNIQGPSQVAQVGLQQQRSYSTSSVHEQRPTWSKTPGYGYMMDPSQHSVTYSSSAKTPAFPETPSTGQYGLSMDIPGAQSHSQGYGAPMTTPSTEFQNLSMQSPAQAAASHDQTHSHASFDMSASHMQPAQGYQASQQQQREGSLQRTSLASSYPQPPASGGYPQPGMDYQGSAGQTSYQYGQYRGPG
ncbi:hypothetical protein K461DRAFT_11817 [Myriangium duriaei CBS 260.36]|uniref:BZIP domain-containing protein n=1 Tax=Myriangium duriaei CBS 260.36 TaxID=1168546 RepID=A0A9P4J986_9PEZI|nr:hypothetical protein K461DRAFT_11817 [Myriangium duriaei CBS 260.36]